MKKRKLQPVVQGDWWLIGQAPDLRRVLPAINVDTPFKREPNDHCIFQSPDGAWHLWACVRRTEVGRCLCHWEAARLTDSPWRFTGDIIRADRTAGESCVAWHGQEFLQSPFVVHHRGTWFMTYGGYAIGVDPAGAPTTDYSRMENQVSLMTSPDARTWTRHRDALGRSRIFAGPGAVRDQYLVNFDGVWHIYYAGHHDRDRNTAGIYVRTSRDLLHWSPWKIAHFDRAPGVTPFIPESPVVVFRDGYYYLFRTHGPEGGTYVYRSDDPCDFGVGDPRGKFVCRLPGIIAPELVSDRRGNEYISNICNPRGGYAIHLCRLLRREQA